MYRLKNEYFHYITFMTNITNTEYKLPQKIYYDDDEDGHSHHLSTSGFDYDFFWSLCITF